MTKDKFEAMNILNEDDIPCGPILSMKELAEDQSLRATGTDCRSRASDSAAPICRSAIPIKLSDSPSDVLRSPLLGEHTNVILHEVLGLDENAVGEIWQSGALGAAQQLAAE